MKSTHSRPLCSLCRRLGWWESEDQRWREGVKGVKERRRRSRRREMWRAVACSKQKQQQQQNNTAFCTQILVVGLLVNQLDCFIVCTASYPLWLLPLYKLHSPLWSGSWNSIHSAKAILPRSLTRCIRYIWGVFHDFRDVWNLCGKTMVKGSRNGFACMPVLGSCARELWRSTPERTGAYPSRRSDMCSVRHVD